MNQYEIDEAARKVAGYLLGVKMPPDPFEQQFEAARSECLVHMRRGVSDVENLTLDQYRKAKK